MPGPYGYNGEGVARFSDISIEPLAAGTPSLSASLAATPITATGSTAARSLAARAADVVNVLDYGAKGDGVTDDSAAINAALSSGRAVFLPSNRNYFVGSTVSVPSGGLLFSDQAGSSPSTATITGSNSLTPVLALTGGTTNGSPISASNLAITRQGSVTAGSGLVGVAIVGSGSNGVVVNYPKISGLYVTNHDIGLSAQNVLGLYFDKVIFGVCNTTLVQLISASVEVYFDQVRFGLNGNNAACTQMLHFIGNGSQTVNSSINTVRFLSCQFNIAAQYLVTFDGINDPDGIYEFTDGCHAEGITSAYFNLLSNCVSVPRIQIGNVTFNSSIPLFSGSQSVLSSLILSGGGYYGDQTLDVSATFACTGAIFNGNVTVSGNQGTFVGNLVTGNLSATNTGSLTSEPNNVLGTYTRTGAAMVAAQIGCFTSKFKNVSSTTAYTALIGESGTFYYSNQSGQTINLPASSAQTGATFGIYAGAPITLAASTAFTGTYGGATSISLNTNQWIFVTSSGGNWYIVAGDPQLVRVGLPALTALPANPVVSGSEYQWGGISSLDISVPVSFAPTSTAAAVATLYVSPNSGMSPSIVCDTISEAAGAVTGAVRTLKGRIPPGWWYQINTTNCTIQSAASGNYQSITNF